MIFQLWYGIRHVKINGLKAKKYYRAEIVDFYWFKVLKLLPLTLSKCKSSKCLQDYHFKTNSKTTLKLDKCLNKTIKKATTASCSLHDYHLLLLFYLNQVYFCSKNSYICIYLITFATYSFLIVHICFIFLA